MTLRLLLVEMEGEVGVLRGGTAAVVLRAPLDWMVVLAAGAPG